jgi:predicted TIM-barrel fold metal-dependent hydrolase
MPGAVDCAVRGVLEDERRLLPYLPARWRGHLDRFGARASPDGRAVGAAAPAGLDGRDIALAVLLPVTPPAPNNLELAAALAGAVNDWQVAEWLDREPRLRASIVVAHEDAPLAVAEIERRAADRRFVQVRLPGRAHAPIGDRRYWPILEAAERHGLPLCVEPCDHAGLISLVLSGVLERLPKLRVFSPPGLAELPPLLWRLDGCWKVLKDEVPDLRRLPSEYIRHSVWFGLGALDGPRLRQTVDHLGYDDRIVLAGDNAPAALEPKLLHDNAIALHADRL